MLGVCGIIAEIHKKLDEACRKHDLGEMSEEENEMYETMLEHVEAVLDGISVLYIKYKASPAERALVAERLRNALLAEQERRGALSCIDNEAFMVGIYILIQKIEAR